MFVPILVVTLIFIKLNHIYTPHHPTNCTPKLHSHVATKDPTPYKHSSYENNGQRLLDGLLNDPNVVHRK